MLHLDLVALEVGDAHLWLASESLELVGHCLGRVNELGGILKALEDLALALDVLGTQLVPVHNHLGAIRNRDVVRETRVELARGILGHLVIPFKWNVFRPPDGVFAVERLFDMSWFPVIPSVGVNVFHHGSDDFPHSPVPDL